MNRAPWQVSAHCGNARSGVLHLTRGKVHTPAFMPVGTLGAVRGGIHAADVAQLGFDMILANTFHLWQRPGLEVLAAHGGLHGFNAWHRPILTDSGGFQVFSLAAMRKVSDDGVHFRAPHNGQACFLSPEQCMHIQRTLNSDIAMVLDECVSAQAPLAEARSAMRRSLHWAQRCRDAFADSENALFGIVQGGVHLPLRQDSAAALTDMGFDGYAIGGLAVGEARAQRQEVLAAVAPQLPAYSPRYLMGIGTPADIACAVAEGVDLFDCVLPTRNARNGQLFTRHGIVRIKNACHQADERPLEEGCTCSVCHRTSRAYLHHLFRVGDMLAARLATLHNLAYYRRLLAELRAAIADNTLPQAVAAVCAAYP